jgi:type II secretory pathway pseudopilin PulG
MLVIAVIAILAALILGTSGYVQRKGNTSRAEAEIKALEAAAESYKADNGEYPPTPSGSPVDPAKTSDPAKYQTAAQDLYHALAGAPSSAATPPPGVTTYFNIPLKMTRTVNGTTGVADPYRNYYGYSRSGSYNPTFELWSTANVDPLPDGRDTTALQPRWIKNW